MRLPGQFPYHPTLLPNFPVKLVLLPLKFFHFFHQRLHGSSFHLIAE